MKISPKQIAIIALCIIIAFIPTYVAITYYFIQSDTGGDYTVSITDNNGNEIKIAEKDIDDVAKAVLKMNSKLYAATNADNSILGEKYYTISVNDGDSTVEYKYYFSTDENSKTIVRDSDGKYFYLDFKDAEGFLSKPYAHIFYDNASIPTLSIFGGNDVLPIEGEWKFTAVNGKQVGAVVETVSETFAHSMNSSTKLSFAISPDKCTITVKNGSDVVGTYTRLEDIPYSMLDSADLTFEIYAEWKSSDEYSGYAKYRFTSTVGGTPEFLIEKTTIASGEFFLVSGKNISAPHKIEFSSTPSINYEPLFFSEGDNVYALIPINKDLGAPQTYVFNFAYGGRATEIDVHVTQRNILNRDYDCSNITASINSDMISEYNTLLNEVGSKCETERYFSDKFIDYDTEFSSDTAGIILGFGHKRVPSNGDVSFRLDGVDYYMSSDTDAVAIASGKVVYVGTSPLIGKFIVIDHGLGLKTWYCQLDEIYLSVGETAARGDAVGKPGSTGYTNSTGVYLITTIKNIPVCPYSLQEDGLDLTK